LGDSDGMDIQSPCYFIVGDGFQFSHIGSSTLCDSEPTHGRCSKPEPPFCWPSPKTTPKGLEPHNINAYGPRLKKLKLNNSNNLMRITHWIP